MKPEDKRKQPFDSIANCIAFWEGAIDEQDEIDLCIRRQRKREAAIMKRRKRFYYKPGKCTCDETFDVYKPDGTFIVSVRFWERRAWAEKEAKKIVRLLNKHREQDWVPSFPEDVK